MTHMFRGSGLRVAAFRGTSARLGSFVWIGPDPANPAWSRRSALGRGRRGQGRHLRPAGVAAGPAAPADVTELVE